MPRPSVQVWTMRVGVLTAADTAGWMELLDGTEKRAAARFAFPRHRIQYVGAHALTRIALGAAVSVDPADWQWMAGPHGKPAALLAGAPAPVSFNISHAEGVVGVAVLAAGDAELGFDVEPFDRTVDLGVADRYFRPEEVAWLASLEEVERRHGFMRLWTLKEAFIKATGEGLSRDLASFWFEMAPPRLRFASSDDRSGDDWKFEQKILDGGFVAAVGLRTDPGKDMTFAWREVDPAILQDRRR